MPKAYIGIGSNLRKRKDYCIHSISLLEESGISVLKRSEILETDPWGVTDQPKFLNMVIEIETDLKPDQLLQLLKKTERACGREESIRWGPRTIDLDILLYENLVIKTPDLEIPHPLMHKREFVLRPLAEIAPNAIHPVLKKTVQALLRELTESHTS